jgi:hypothetical protein
MVDLFHIMTDDLFNFYGDHNDDLDEFLSSIFIFNNMEAISIAIDSAATRNFHEKTQS